MKKKKGQQMIREEGGWLRLRNADWVLAMGDV